MTTNIYIIIDTRKNFPDLWNRKTSQVKAALSLKDIHIHGMEDGMEEEEVAVESDIVVEDVVN